MGVVKQKNWFIFFFPKSSYSCAKQTKAKALWYCWSAAHLQHRGSWALVLARWMFPFVCWGCSSSFCLFPSPCFWCWPRALTASSVCRALVSLAAYSSIQPLGLKGFWLLWQVLVSHSKCRGDNTHLDGKTSPKSASCVADLKSIWQDASSHLQRALALQHLLPLSFSFCFLPTSLLFGF